MAQSSPFAEGVELAYGLLRRLPMHATRLPVAALTALLAMPGAARLGASQHHDRLPTLDASIVVPALDTTCRPAVAELLSRGLAHLYAGDAADAAAAFRQAAHSDVDCVMAYWGSALGFWDEWERGGQPEALGEGWRALDFAAMIRRAPSAREQRYLDSATLLYRERLGSGRRQMVEELLDLAEDVPEDAHARLLAAVSAGRLRDGADSLPLRRRALRLVSDAGPLREAVAGLLAAVAAGDAPELAVEVLPQARALAATTDPSPRVLQQASHAFLHLGLWNEAVIANRRAVDAALRRGARRDELQALNALTFALLRAGRADQAGDIARRIAQGYLASVPGAHAADERAAIVGRVAIESEAWDLADRYAAREERAAATLPVRLAAYIAAARRGDPGPAPDVTSFGPTQGRIAAAWRAFGQGETEQAVALLQDAVEHEAAAAAGAAWVTPLVPAAVHLDTMRRLHSRPRSPGEAFGRDVAERGAPDGRRLTAAVGSGTVRRP
ncbi:MAG: hypothetical protein AB7U83_13655 [Vicinamibacterales bacterium]